MTNNKFRGRTRAQVREGQQWYRIVKNQADSSADVHIYDEIGFWGVTAADFVAELSAIDASTINLHINSPGGEVFDGIAIYNCLRAHSARIVSYVDSLAASIASVIAMAGDEVVMAPGAQMMIHEGSGMCIGDANDMREMADLLDRQSDNIASIYAERAGGTTEDWRTAMRAETWYNAQEAVSAGLADRVSEPARQPAEPAMSAKWDLSVFRYAGRDGAPAPTARAEPVEPPVRRAEPGRFLPAPVAIAPDDDGIDYGALAEAFRGGFGPEVPDPIPDENFVFDVVEFHNAIREGLISS